MAESFRDRPWHERIRALGDEAEAAYMNDRDARGIRWSDYGLCRPPFRGPEMTQLPNSIRYAPDFIESWGGQLRFIEVQGVGADQRIKIKDDKLQTLAEHNYDLPVYAFVWNNRIGRYALLPFAQLALLVADAATRGQCDVFDPQGRHPKPFTWIWWDKLAANAETRRIAQARGSVGARMAGGTAS